MQFHCSLMRALPPLFWDMRQWFFCRLMPRRSAARPPAPLFQMPLLLCRNLFVIGFSSRGRRALEWQDFLWIKSVLSLKYSKKGNEIHFEWMGIEEMRIMIILMRGDEMKKFIFYRQQRKDGKRIKKSRIWRKFATKIFNKNGYWNKITFYTDFMLK